MAAKYHLDAWKWRIQKKTNHLNFLDRWVLILPLNSFSENFLVIEQFNLLEDNEMFAERQAESNKNNKKPPMVSHDERTKVMEYKKATKI